MMVRKGLGAVKDQSSIGLAKITNISHARSELEVSIVKATRHDEFPAEEKHMQDILRLTRQSRGRTTACVRTIGRRLSNTRCWSVALKALILVHRLLVEGNLEYEREFFYATRRGTRLLNMSDFRDTSTVDSFDLSGLVRTFALYLDTRLEYRMHSRPNRRLKCTCHWKVHGIKFNIKTGRFRLESRCERHRLITNNSVEDDTDEDDADDFSPSDPSTSLKEMNLSRIFTISQHLLDLLERFLVCRFTFGILRKEEDYSHITEAVENNRIVLVALSILVKESYQTYFGIVEIMRVLDDQFEKLPDNDNKIHNVFLRASRLFDELEIFYCWCKKVGIGRHSEYPEVDTISWTKRFVSMNELGIKKWI